MEKVILAGLDLNGAIDSSNSMEELEELAKAADMEVIGIVTRKLL